MTEKEKARAGLLYDGNYEPEMFAERIRAKDLCHKFNLLSPAELEAGKDILRRLFGGVAGDFHINAPFYCDYGYNISLGKQFYANHNLTILDAAPVTFGDNVFIGPSCGFYTAGHPIDAEQRNLGLEIAWPISVGSDVWIGGNTVVMPGLSIGSNVVIGAGSVVTKNIPDNVIAMGNPCRVFRPITEEDKHKYRSR